ncbi:MAG: Holliday junction resolvase RuvX [Ignavibacteriales bacterium]|nr:Holliday junction resolvase RuvX [Ignavibacteriales bacterium]
MNKRGIRALQNERYLAIDFGLKRIGIAVTDPLNIFAYPLVTLANDKIFFEQLKKILKKYQITKIIIGYPEREDKKKTALMLDIERLKNNIEEEFNISVDYFDELYSSKLATEYIIESVPSKKKRQNKGLVDRHAAAIILSDYIKIYNK